MEGYLQKLEGTDRGGALLVIDVDHFKAVNDNFGHESGDDALKLIAGSIKGAVREGDIVGRIGGEEFSVFLPAAPPALMKLVAERVRLAVSELAYSPQGELHPLSVSVGCAAFRFKTTFTDLFRHADKQLYDAKHDGRNRIAIDLSLYDRPLMALAS